MPKQMKPSRSVLLAFLLMGVSTRAHGDTSPPTPTPSPRALEAIRLIESSDPYEQQVGFLRLEALREPSTIEVLERYAAHPQAQRRAAGLRALAAIQGSSAAPRLLERLKTDRDAAVRRAILLGLEPFALEHPDILPALLKALRDRDTEVRMTAVDIVSRIDDPRAREAIRFRYKYEWRRDVRRVLASAMPRLEK